jgi:5-methylcytosine-specific restriction enzyme A
MPRSAKNFCKHPGCGVVCDGRFCAQHQQQDPRAERRRAFDRYRGSAASRGYGRRHEKWRKLVLHRDPLCKIAHFCGGIAPSRIADHIIPLNAGGDWSLDNGQGACEPCHDWKTATRDSKFIQEKRGG